MATYSVTVLTTVPVSESTVDFVPVTFDNVEANSPGAAKAAVVRLLRAADQQRWGNPFVGSKAKKTSKLKD